MCIDPKMLSKRTLEGCNCMNTYYHCWKTKMLSMDIGKDGGNSLNDTHNLV